MRKFTAEPLVTLYHGDVLEVLASLPGASVQCCVTSPPYFALRDYGVPGQIGLEDSVEEYVAKMVDVFAAVRRVLRNDGTLWLNLGDSYAGSWGNYHPNSPPGKHGQRVKETARWNRPGYESQEFLPATANLKGLKPKDLCMIPARVALALQQDGWWLRSEITWVKKAPMPESVTDRPTSATEKVYLLAKSERYFYDADAVREPAEYGFSQGGFRGGGDGGYVNGRAFDNSTDGKHGTVKPGDGSSGRNLRNAWILGPEPFSGGASYGSCRISSPDCPVHDYHADLDRALARDAQSRAFLTDRNLGNGAHPALVQEGAVISIPVDHPAFPLDESFAIPRSRRMNKTEDELERDVIFCGIPESHSESRELILHSVATFFRTHGSKNGAGSAQDDERLYPSVGKRYRIFGIATYSQPPSNCLCHYKGKLQSRKDHFAVFPTEIPRRAILAGTSEAGCCSACGAPWARVVERVAAPNNGGVAYGRARKADPRDNRDDLAERPDNRTAAVTTGWRPTCDHDAPVTQCTVLDPFVGSGTTAAVAKSLNRRSIGIDLSQEYLLLAQERVAFTPMPLPLTAAPAKEATDGQLALGLAL